MTGMPWGAPDPGEAATRLGVPAVIGCPCPRYQSVSADGAGTCACTHRWGVHDPTGTCLDWVPYEPGKPTCPHRGAASAAGSARGWDTAPTMTYDMYPTPPGIAPIISAVYAPSDHSRCAVPVPPVLPVLRVLAVTEARSRWQAEDPDHRTASETTPDLYTLLTWLMDDADRARAGGWFLGRCGAEREPDGQVCTADLYAPTRDTVQVQCPRCGGWTGVAAPGRPRRPEEKR